MPRYALRFLGSPVFLSNMVVPKRYAPRFLGSAVLLPQPPLPDANITLYARSGDNTLHIRDGNITLYER